jgi:NAD+ diphosphatase
LPQQLPEEMARDESLKRFILGEVDGLPCYMVVAAEPPDVPQDQGELQDLRALAELLPETLFMLAGRACQLETFLNNHRFCGRCGGRMRHVQWEQAMHCDHCQHRCYPRLSPCIIVAIRRGDEILLAQNKRHRPGVYSIIAGFIEAGETVEQAVHRELLEEVGIRVKNLRYRGSQPWPFPHALMMGFTADYCDGELKIDRRELTDAGWFKAAEKAAFPPLPANYTVARQLIELLLSEIESEIESASVGRKSKQ